MVNYDLLRDEGILVIRPESPLEAVDFQKIAEEVDPYIEAHGKLHGVMIDAEIYATPWGFPLEEVRAPVALWHGTKDRTFAHRLAKDVASRLPNCEFHLVEGAGHYSLPIRYIEEILADLLA